MTRTVAKMQGTALALLGLAALAGTPARAQTVIITQWTFNSDNGVPNTSPATSIGTGVASSLGMTNSYTSAVAGANGSTDDSDVFTAVIASDGSSSDPGSSLWRIRGGGKNADGSTSGNGWNSAAPQYTQGAQFTTSTAGNTNIQFTFDWAATKQGVNTLQVRYTTDGTNYQNYTGNIVNSSGVESTNGTLTFAPITSGQPWLNANVVDFSGITAANNNPNFGVELVSAYANGTSAYQSTTGAALNNSSGNWRFDNVSFSTTAAPEPSGFVAMFIGVTVLGLIAVRRRLAGSATL